jgi:hypothetical protein
VTVQVPAGAFTFFDTDNSASNTVSVTASPKKTPTANDLAYTIPTGHVYTGSAQGIGAVAAEAEDGLLIDAPGVIAKAKPEASAPCMSSAHMRVSYKKASNIQIY